MISAVFAKTVARLSCSFCRLRSGVTWWPIGAMKVIVRRRCAFGIAAKYSASPSIAATPDPLSTAASQKPSVCAMTRMFSSVVPGSTPNTADGLRLVRDSIASRIRIFTGVAAVDQLAQRGAVVEADREPRHLGQVRSFAAAAPELGREVAGNAEHDDDGRRALLLRRAASRRWSSPEWLSALGVGML